MTTPSDTLTVDMLYAAIAAIEKMPPAPRIIVGFPLVAADRIIVRDADGLILIGAKAFEAFKRLASQTTEIMPTSIDRVFGIAVEHYDFNKPKHRALLRELLGPLAALAARKTRLEDYTTDCDFSHIKDL